MNDSKFSSDRELLKLVFMIYSFENVHLHWTRVTDSVLINLYRSYSLLKQLYAVIAFFICHIGPLHHGPLAIREVNTLASPLLTVDISSLKNSGTGLTRHILNSLGYIS